MVDQKPDPQVSPQPSEITLSELISIYQVTSEDNRVYNNIVWQFPTALIAANGLILEAFSNSPSIILLIVSLLNFSLLHALFKLGHNQHAIIMALQRTEKQIKNINQNRYQEYLPDFKKGQSKILGKSSRNLINYTLLLINSIYFVIEFIRTIQENFPRIIS